MGDVTQFRGRAKAPPPPQRQSRIRPLGVQMGGLKTPCTILTFHGERDMREDGRDWVMPWSYIAVKDRALVVYGKGMLPPYAGKAANDKE